VLLQACTHLKELDLSQNELTSFDSSGSAGREKATLQVLSTSLTDLRLDDNNFGKDSLNGRISDQSWQTLSAAVLPALELLSFNGNRTWL
jgi:hypothetical protein